MTVKAPGKACHQSSPSGVSVHSNEIVLVETEIGSYNFAKFLNER